MTKHFKITSILCIVLMFFQIISPAAYAYSYDYSGYWAEGELNKWKSYGILNEDDLSLLNPDSPISRGDFAVLLNKVFGFSDLTTENFIDVDQGSEYYEAMLIAKEAGYYIGNHHAEVNAHELLTRQDALVALDRILYFEDSSEEVLAFNDLEDVRDYAIPSLKIFNNLNIISGYLDDTFKPTKGITLGETIQLLSNIIESYYSMPGTYENVIIEGNTVINGADITLSNSTINGNLYLTEGIDDGEVYLNNVTVTGGIFVFGGGENSIYLQDVTSPQCTVKKKDGKVRLVASGSTSIDDLSLQSGVTIEEDSIQKGHTGFLNASISGEISIEDTISFQGNFNTISINSNSKVKLENCNVTKVEIASALEEELNNELTTVLEIISSSIENLISDAQGCKIAISNTSKINNVTISAKTSLEFSNDSIIDNLTIEEGALGTTIDGDGTISQLDVDSDDVFVNGGSVPAGTIASFGPDTNSTNDEDIISDDDDSDDDDSDDDDSDDNDSDGDDSDDNDFDDNDSDNNDSDNDDSDDDDSDNDDSNDNDSDDDDSDDNDSDDDDSNNDDPSDDDSDGVTTLIADTLDNDYGNDVTLTIENNNGFSNNISEITIDGNPIPLVYYTIGTNSITIDGSIFNEKDEDGYSYTLDSNQTPTENVIEMAYSIYEIVVKSTGYSTQEVNQELYTSNNVSLPIISSGVYYNYNSQSDDVYPVDDLEEIAVDEFKQYYGVYKVSYENYYLLLNASEVADSNLGFTISDNSIVSLTDTGYATALSIGETTMTVTFNDTSYEVPIKTGYSPPELTKDTTNTVSGEDIDLTIVDDDNWTTVITSVKTNDTSFNYQITDDIITVESAAFESPSSYEYIYTDSNEQMTIDNVTYDTVFENVYGNTLISVDATDYISSTVWQDVYMTSASTSAAIMYMDIITSGSDFELIIDEENSNQLYAKLTLEDGTKVKPGYYTNTSYYYDVVNHKESELSIDWSSSDESIATVDDDGTITAVSSGEVEITATYNNTVTTKTIIVNNPSVDLTADSSVTTTSASLTITFDDNDWVNNLESIYLVDEDGSENIMDSDDYTVNSDNIVVDAQSLMANYTTSGSIIVYLPTDNTIIKSSWDLYTFLMESTYYEDSTVIQPIDLGTETMVTLTSDTTDNRLGSSIQIAYEDTIDDFDFGNTIVSISVNDIVLPISYYTIDSGYITFDDSLFTSEGAFEIEVNAVDINGIFGLDSYYLEVTQVITPEEDDNGLMYLLNDSTVYGVYEDNTTTSSSIYMLKEDTNEYTVATYDSTTTTGSAIIMEFELSDSYEADNYSIYDNDVIAVGTVSSTTSSAIYALVYGLSENDDIHTTTSGGLIIIGGNDDVATTTSGAMTLSIGSDEISITTSGGLTIVEDGESIPDNGTPLEDGDTIMIYYYDQYILTYRWTGSEWIVE